MQKQAVKEFVAAVEARGRYESLARWSTDWGAEKRTVLMTKMSLSQVI